MGTLASLAAANTDRGGLRSQNVSTGGVDSAMLVNVARDCALIVPKAATPVRQQSWTVFDSRMLMCTNNTKKYLTAVAARHEALVRAGCSRRSSFWPDLQTSNDMRRR